jgi:hypothetical protein
MDDSKETTSVKNKRVKRKMSSILRISERFFLEKIKILLSNNQKDIIDTTAIDNTIVRISNLKK